MSHLDDLLNDLAKEPADKPLDQLEADVWQRINALTASRVETQFTAAIQAVLVSLALLAGALTGTTEAAAVLNASHEISVFSARPDLAPSTLLERRR